MKLLLAFLGLAGIGAWLLPAAGRAVKTRVHKTEDAAVQTAQHLEVTASQQLAELSDRLVSSVEGAMSSVGAPGPATGPGVTPLAPVSVQSVVPVPRFYPEPEVWPLPFHPLYAPWAPRFAPRFLERMPPHRRRGR